VTFLLACSSVDFDHDNQTISTAQMMSIGREGYKL